MKRSGVAIAMFVILGLSQFPGGVMAADKTEVILYDDFETDLNNDGAYTIQDYYQKWSNPYGLGEMAAPPKYDTRSFADGNLFIDDAPFVTSIDYSVYDHIKYFATSNDLFTVPVHGSITFSADIKAFTPGAEDGRIIKGTYGPPFSYPAGAPYEASVMEGQQAAATLHMLNIHETGQLFDWLVSGTKAFCLTERLPYPLAADPTATIDNIYTQVVKEVDIAPGSVHNYAIRYSRPLGDGADKIEFLLDGDVVGKVKKAGLPLDIQNPNKYDDIIYPSVPWATGEVLKDRMYTFQIAHGAFSLLDAFPFQHPDAPELSVSIPVENRIFGQGVTANFDNFQVVIETK